MGKRDPRVDAYIAKARDFAKPILRSVRETVHRASPDIEEDMKWGTPTFMSSGLVCGVAAFKQHCALLFWKAPLIFPRNGGNEAFRRFRCLETVSDLPSRKELTAWVRKGIELNKAGVRMPRPRTAARKALKVPADLAHALKKNKKAQGTFDAFSPSHRREYIQWITEAKRDDTRARRLRTAIAQMAEGKPQNWKYMK
jgi:uncharacterized protein YdeI (YjbR/CyaY-like superfamily)